MKTYEFYNRLLRTLVPRTLDALTMNEAQELVDALNSALQSFYRIAPNRYKKREYSYYLPTPRTIEVDVRNGSKLILDGLHTEDGFAILTEDEEALEPEGIDNVSGEHMGASIRIDGDANWNRVAATNTLLDAYQGEDGVHSATIYADNIILSGVDIEAVNTDPVLSTGDRLLYDSTAQNPLSDLSTYRRNFSNFKDRNTRQLGQPERYCVAHIGSSDDSVIQAQGILLLDPLPVLAYNLRFEATHRPRRYGMDSLLAASSLIPVSDDLIESILYPIAVGALIYSDMWRNSKMISMARDESYTAEARARNLAAYVATPNNQCGTPIGY